MWAAENLAELQLSSGPVDKNSAVRVTSRDPRSGRVPYSTNCVRYTAQPSIAITPSFLPEDIPLTSSLPYISISTPVHSLATWTKLSLPIVKPAATPAGHTLTPITPIIPIERQGEGEDKKEWSPAMPREQVIPELSIVSYLSCQYCIISLVSVADAAAGVELR